MKSKSPISELAHYRFDNFQHPVLTFLADLEMGWHVLEKAPGAAALDYIRGNPLNFEDGVLLPHDIRGAENYLLDLIKPILQTACTKGSKVYLFW